jgi:Uncharacterized phage-associated protein
MYSALAIAKHIIDFCNSNSCGTGISNLKLQKLLYFVQAEFLVSLGTPCFANKIEAWDFGPVVPNVYHLYKAYGSTNIPKSEPIDCGQIDDYHQKVIDNVIRALADYSAVDLMTIIHKQDPWRNAYRYGQHREISNAALQRYFAIEPQNS